MDASFTSITLEHKGHVGLITLRKPPHNYFDNALIREIAAAFERCDRDDNVRVLVLAAEGNRSARAPISSTAPTLAPSPKAVSTCTKKPLACFGRENL